MEIKNKETFKAELKKRIAKDIRQFPYYFYGNIVLNIIIIAIIIVTAGIAAASLAIPSVFLVYSLIFIAGLLKVLHITIRDFLKNIRILSAIQAGHYDLDIEDYELDNTLEFIEQLPMEKEDVLRMKKELSFGKLIDILDLFGIITCDGEVYDTNLIFAYETEEALGEENEESNAAAEYERKIENRTK